MSLHKKLMLGLALSSAFSLVACHSAVSKDPTLDANSGGPASELPRGIVDGLSTDAAVLRCSTDAASGQVKLDLAAFKLSRLDLDDDGAPEWIIAGTGACLSPDGRSPWWILRGARPPAEADGPSLLLRTDGARLALLSTRHQGFRDLRLDDAVLLEYAGQAYESAGVPTSRRAPQVREQTLIDLRKAPFPQAPKLGDDERQRVLGFADLGADVAINSVVKGHFSSAGGAEETVYLLQQGGPRASDPSPGRSSLLIVAGDQLVGRIDAEVPGNFIVAAPSLDDSGRQTLLLRGDYYQMGEGGASLTLVTIEKQVSLRTIARFERLLRDRCEATPAGPRQAAVIRQTADARFEVERFVAECEAGSEFRSTGTQFVEAQ